LYWLTSAAGLQHLKSLLKRGVCFGLFTSEIQRVQHQ